MLGNRKLILDTRCEIYDAIKPQSDGIFWDFEKHIQKNELVPGAIYVIGREQARIHATKIRELIESNTISVVYSNPTEGSEPMESNLIRGGYTELLTQGKLLVVTGGDIDPAYTQLLYENFLGKVHDYDENVQAIQDYADKKQTDRPYKFLFYNGRMREHRKYLLCYFRDSGLLDQSLWTNLDPTHGVATLVNGLGSYILTYRGQRLQDIRFPERYLPAEYEVSRYRENLANSINVGPSTEFTQIRSYLFKNEWGDIYLSPTAYLDTYFSLVTETVFVIDRSFRTEKIWKPIAIGHPFIVASNRGYYRDLQNLGFRTFGHLIDESFDSIDNPQDRIERIAAVTEDLCQQDLPAFITAAEEVCKYNQQLLEELRPKVRAEFPERFFQFINRHFNE